MKIIYVDDEKINLIRFEMIISEMDKNHELFIFEDPESALEFAKENKPDIAFLDIEMQEKDGIWLARHMASLSIPFAFVTAHQGYAVQAFSLSALHYIIKPINQKAISEVLFRLEEIKAKNNTYEITEQLKLLINKNLPVSYPKKIFIKKRSVVTIMSLSNILYFEAAGSYTTINCIEGENHKSSKLLNTYQELLLDHPDFIRIHRAFIINRNHVVAVLKDDQRTRLKMIDDSELDVSPNLKEQILDLLKM